MRTHPFLVRFLSAITLAGLTLTLAAVPEYNGDLDPFPCLDTASFKSQLQNGDLDAIYKEIEGFVADGIATHKSVPLPCWAGILRYRAVLAFAIKNDTAAAGIYLAQLVKIAPNVEMFDLGISKAVQDMLDQTKEEMRVLPNSDEMLQLRLIPSPSFNFPNTDRLEGMRQKYHDLRILFAISKSSTQLADIGKALRGETDPAFKLFNAQIMLMFGAAQPKVRQLVNDAIKGQSEFISEKNISDWAKRLEDRITYLEKKGQSGTKAMKTIFGSGK